MFLDKKKTNYPMTQMLCCRNKYIRNNELDQILFFHDVMSLMFRFWDSMFTSTHCYPLKGRVREFFNVGLLQYKRDNVPTIKSVCLKQPSSISIDSLIYCNNVENIFI